VIGCCYYIAAEHMTTVEFVIVVMQTAAAVGAHVAGGYAATVELKKVAAAMGLDAVAL